MEFLDYYAILGVPPAASEDDLRQAYRLAARRFHPDVNPSPGAAAAFRDMNRAYEVLSNPVSRAEYDSLRQDQADQGSGLLLETSMSRHSLRPLDEPQLLYVMVKVQPVLGMSLTSDAPLNLCLVVDRSTSMKGGRLQQVKLAVHRIMDECGPDDVISVVSFSDRADVLVPAQTPADPRALKSMVSTMRAEGATAILSGLKLGLDQIEQNRDSRFVNHIVLITDGRTYGDEEDCLALASKAHDQGVGISGMGIGEDWNDRFLDALASRTGGASAYINAPEAVSRFLQERVRSLATAYAERAQLLVAPSVGVDLQLATRISPHPLALETDPQPIPLGAVDGKLGTKLVLQFRLTTGQSKHKDFYVGRIDVRGEVLGARHRGEVAIQDLTVGVVDKPVEEPPPAELLDALNRLALYRLQDRAREALEVGDISEATRKLEYLATRLFESGAESLGQAALHEARRVAHTHQLSEEGSKQLKYGTRALFSLQGDAYG